MMEISKKNKIIIIIKERKEKNVAEDSLRTIFLSPNLVNVQLPWGPVGRWLPLRSQCLSVYHQDSSLPRQSCQESES